MERLEHDDPAAKVLAGDRRLTMQLMGLWRGLRVADGCPGHETFLAAVPPELLEDCFVAVPTAEGGALCRIGGRLRRGRRHGPAPGIAAGHSGDREMQARAADHAALWINGLPL
ncbi:MAG TPA: hypothetical protein VGC25_05955 [Alphaproteobacteria bacterium]|jgi:hypothetical protein